MRRTLKATVVASLLMLVTAAPAVALRKDTISLRTGQSFERTYEPIRGMAPSLFSPTLEACMDSDACHVHTVRLTTPGPVGHKTIVRVEWPDPLEANDLDVYLFEPDGAEVIHAATSSNPESLGAVRDPDDSKKILDEGVVDLPAGTYYLAIINWAGVNGGYTVKATIVEQPIEIFRAPAPAAPVSTQTRAPAPVVPSAAPVAPATAPDVGETRPAPENVDLPGADGPAGTQSLHALPASSQGQLLSGGVSAGAVVAGVLLAMAAAGGGVFVVQKIRRDIA
jgi:hypothetical protein